MQILAIESSTKILSVSLSESGAEIASFHLKSNDGFMSSIINSIDAVLKKGRSNIEKIDIFAGNTGPGDFTGTRIGLSILKTLSFVEEKPLYGISSLDVYAASILENNSRSIKKDLLQWGSAIAVPVIDVKRNELFFSIYEASFSEYPESVASHRLKQAGIFIRKVTGDYLVEYENFRSLLEKVFLSGSLILTNAEKTMIYCGGTAFGSYSHLGPDLKKLNYNFILNKRAIFPHAGCVNICANFRAMRELEKEKKIIGDKNVVPAYVREFKPFK